jgi:transcription elongation factor SPT6
MTEKWLENYCVANEKRSMYSFCAMTKYPGHFWICFQMSVNGPKGAWPIKVIPNAFELQKHVYPDMSALKNGFKMLIGAAAAKAPARR